MWFVCLIAGAAFGFILCAFLSSDKDRCDTCKYRKIGINAFTGEMQEPCNMCCHKYQDFYTEIQT